MDYQMIQQGIFCPKLTTSCYKAPSMICTINWCSFKKNCLVNIKLTCKYFDSCSFLLVYQYTVYSKICVKWPLSKRLKIGFQGQVSLNAGQKYCRMLQGEHSAIHLTFIKLHLLLRSLFCLFLSGRFTQVLLYIYI